MVQIFDASHECSICENENLSIHDIKQSVNLDLTTCGD